MKFWGSKMHWRMKSKLTLTTTTNEMIKSETDPKALRNGSFLPYRDRSSAEAKIGKEVRSEGFWNNNLVFNYNYNLVTDVCKIHSWKPRWPKNNSDRRQLKFMAKSALLFCSYNFCEISKKEVMGSRIYYGIFIRVCLEVWTRVLSNK